MEKRRGSAISLNNNNTFSSPATPLANLSLNSVLLHEWWLCRPQSGGLGVGGFECRGEQGQRVFCSAAISKVHDATTLETADGITIAIAGFINTSRTLQNGFPPEVCSHFLYGFPYDWEEYVSQSSVEESASRDNQASITGSGVLGVNRSSRGNATPFEPASLDNLPALRIRDFLMFSVGDSQTSILERTVLDHMLEKLSTHVSQNAKISGKSNTGENSNFHKKGKVDQNHMDDISDSSRTRTRESEDDGQSKMGPSTLTPTVGVTTRSMTRLKHLTEKQEGLSSKSSVKRVKAVQHSSIGAECHTPLGNTHYGSGDGSRGEDWTREENRAKGNDGRKLPVKHSERKIPKHQIGQSKDAGQCTKSQEEHAGHIDLKHGTDHGSSAHECRMTHEACEMTRGYNTRTGRPQGRPRKGEAKSKGP